MKHKTIPGSSRGESHKYHVSRGFVQDGIGRSGTGSYNLRFVDCPQMWRKPESLDQVTFAVLLQIQGVSKTFVDRTVLDSIDLELRAGEHVALVGPNGAGKSTLLKILTGELSPDTGTIGLGPRVKVGYVQQHVKFPDGATVWSEACRAG